MAVLWNVFRLQLSQALDAARTLSPHASGWGQSSSDGFYALIKFVMIHFGICLAKYKNLLVIKSCWPTEVVWGLIWWLSYPYGRREYQNFDREPKHARLKSPDGFSSRWETCPWRELPSEMKSALTFELCKWALSGSQQMCFSPVESTDPLECESIQGSHCPSAPTWEGRDGAGGNALFPPKNGREKCLCVRQKSCRSSSGLGMESFIVALSKRCLKIAGSFRKQDICAN